MTKAIKLTPAEQTELLNFGGGRGTKEADVVIKASSRLPDTLTPQQLDLDAPERFKRVGGNLTTVSAIKPTFTEPRFASGRQAIAFTVCVGGSQLAAGSYSGQITVDGPEGLEGTAVTVTANAKDGQLFIIGLVVAMLVAFSLSFYRAVKEQLAAPAKPTLGDAARNTLTSLEFWGQTIFALVAAAIAIYSVYDKDAAWGADKVPSVVALVGTALAAAGLQSFIATVRGQSS